MPDKHMQMKGGGGGGPKKSVWQGTARVGMPTMSPAERADMRKKGRAEARKPRRWVIGDKKK
jgi:hypothetical protein